jgi:hypothetical protein
MSSEIINSLTAGRVQYDSQLKRVWVGTQRLHHGMVGSLFAAAGLVLMAHDWHDRKAWFLKGPQDD